MLPPLLASIVRGDSIESIQKLVNSGFQLDVVDDSGCNVLHYAASTCNIKLFKWCMSQNSSPDIDSVCHNGKTPLMIACTHVNPDISVEDRAEFVKYLSNIPNSTFGQPKGGIHFSYQSGLEKTKVDTAESVFLKDSFDEENSYGYYSIS